MFEQRIGRILVRIGIASRDYIDRLMSEVTQLDRLVARLQHSAACDDATPTALPGIKPAASRQPPAAAAEAAAAVPGPGSYAQRGSSA